MRKEVQTALNRADDFLEDAIFNLEENRYNTAVNRAYYAMYAAAQALLIDKDVYTKTHKGTTGQFSLHYIKTNLLDQRYGQMFSELFDMRQSTDYDFEVVAEQEEAEKACNFATDFVEMAKSWLEQY